MRCGSLIRASARWFPRHHPPRKIFEAGERQIRQDQPVRAQFLEEFDLLHLLGEASYGLARRHGAEPFAPADAAVLDRRQQARYPQVALGRHRRRNQLEKCPLLMAPGGDCETPDVALAE